MIDTAGSLEQVIKALEEREAKEIHILATHGVFSPPALERLNRPNIKELVVCNTLPLKPDPAYPKLKVLSVAQLFGDAIRRIHQNNSISVLFD
jgi:ribose-phosphate pyrophosphokinase